MSDQERRRKRRFPLELKVRYQSTNSKLAISGAGRTLNMSSGGLLIVSPLVMQQGIRLRLMVEWPWLLDQQTPLQLVAESRVVRANGSQFAVALNRYQFRTSGSQARVADPLLWASLPFPA